MREHLGSYVIGHDLSVDGGMIVRDGKRSHGSRTMWCSRLLSGCLLILVITGGGVFAGAPPQADGSRVSRPEGLAAWEQVRSVLVHPRCINCHTAVEYPQQGDARRRHFANVVRGADGHGVPALQCATCHQDANADSTGVPGSHNWHLAPLSMAWQDAHDQPLSSGAICRAVTDRSKNHNMDGPALLKHNADDILVGWAWEPGRDIRGVTRTQPPLSRAQFADATRRWVEAGMPCPEL